MIPNDSSNPSPSFVNSGVDPEVENSTLASDKLLDDLIAQDFTKLSFQDRNAISEEMHGVTSLSPEETPELLVDAIQRLSIELDKIQQKPAYDRSQQWNSISPINGIDCAQSIYCYNKQTLAAGTHSTYVNTLDFRLRFLRAELFDAKNAAIRMVKYLDTIMDLYEGNEELLRRPIALSDLKNKEEKECLKLGNHQLLPFRDRSGRRVIAMVPDLGNQPCIKLRLKVFLYLWSVAADNDETQRKGVVIVMWPRVPEQKRTVRYFPNTTHGAWWLRFFQTIPVRICAFHVCHEKAGNFMKGLFAFAGSILVNNRIRMKVHTGMFVY